MKVLSFWGGPIFTLVAVSFLIYKGYVLDRDIDSMIDRAQVGADREDMHEYLVQLRKNMDEHGITRGHTALLFRNSRNDLSLTYKGIDRLIERLESIKDIPKNDAAYQVALNDIRGTLREIRNPAMGVLWVDYVWWLALLDLLLWCLFAIVVFPEIFPW